jgi:hypothetical protein
MARTDALGISDDVRDAFSVDADANGRSSSDRWVTPPVHGFSTPATERSPRF